MVKGKLALNRQRPAAAALNQSRIFAIPDGPADAAAAYFRPAQRVIVWESLSVWSAAGPAYTFCELVFHQVGGARIRAGRTL